MGPFRSASNYPGRRREQQGGGAVPPPPVAGNAAFPPPMPASVYHNNGIPVRPSGGAAAQHYSALPVAAVGAPSQHFSQQQPVAIATAYVPGIQSNAPVVAQVYVPGAAAMGGGTTAPVVAQAFVPGSAPPAVAVAVAGHAASAPLLDSMPPPMAPPSQYQTNGANSGAMHAYNPNNNNPTTSAAVVNAAVTEFGDTDDQYWECAACTFPNLRTEHRCKACESAIPPGLAQQAPRPPQTHAAVPQSHHHHPPSANSTLNGMSGMIISDPQSQPQQNYGGGGSGGGLSMLRVPIPRGMQPGQKLKVRNQRGGEVVASIPPRSDWKSDSPGGVSNPYFYIQDSDNGTAGIGVGGGGSVTGAGGGGNGWNNFANNAPNPPTAASGESETMRVAIPPGMAPGQKIKVRSQKGQEQIVAIPPRTEWKSDSHGGSNPFFRMTFGAPANAARVTDDEHSAPLPPYTVTWEEFYPRATTKYGEPSLGMRSVPHVPRGVAGGGSGGITPNGRHKALIIGINYTGSSAALKGCINDARNMSTLLRRNGFPDDGSHMLLLTDERARGGKYQPTGSNILKAISWFMKGVRKGDVLFFHFSGHGSQERDKTGHEADGYNETIVPLDYKNNSQISDDVLWGSLVYALPAGARLTALMDMCHSGTGLDLPYDYNVDRRRWTEDVNPAHSAGDAVLFSGCEDSQTSADVQSGYQAGGAMTKAFTEAYQTNPSSTYHEFLAVVKRQLRRKQFSQRPQLTSSQKFDADSRIFSLGHSIGGEYGAPSMIEPNHNPQVGRQKRRHYKPAKTGFGGGGGGGGGFGNPMLNMAAAGVGMALFADALFG